MAPKPYWTPELVFDAFERWEAEHGSLPKSIDWRKLSEEARTTKAHPTDRHVSLLFGGWREAQAAYQQHRKRKKKLWRIWSQEEIVEAFQKWAETHDGMPPAHYEVTHGGHGGALPSLTSINARFGNFRTALQAAGFSPLPPGVTYKSIQRYRPLPRRGES